ncbi:NAD(P)-binding domain-containing protein [Streptomyces sp. A30]|uniref:NAD(P)-binding domain-containing protein n=1 Tax=Streptomyces sp. A30 TaxID=2789273 RepID=UPI0039807AE7
MHRRRHLWPGWLSPVGRAAWLREPLNRTKSSAVRSGRSRPSFVTNLARLAIAVGRRPTVQIPRPQTLEETVAELGRRARAATPEEAARAGDRVVVSIPPAPYRDLSRRRTVGQGRARHRSVRDAP